MCWLTTKRSWAAESICSFIRIASNHEERLQTGAPRVAKGDLCFIDMQLGDAVVSRQVMADRSSGEEPANGTFMLHTPNGAVYDLQQSSMGGSAALFAFGSGSGNRGSASYLGASFAAGLSGAYIADARWHLEATDASGRSVNCSKAVIGVTASGAEEAGLTGFDRAVSQILEVVPLNDPTNLHVGDTLTVQILFKGTPLPDACVTVIPRGKVLPRLGIKNPYDIVTDKDGKASFTFNEANYHLLVVRLELNESAGTETDPANKTRYTGDLTVMVKPSQRIFREACQGDSRTMTSPRDLIQVSTCSAPGVEF